MFRSELGLWYASDYASCQDVFRSPDVGLGFNTTRIEQDPRFEHSDSLKMFGRMIPFMDPPDHTRIRQILAPYFTPQAIEASRPYTQALVDRLLDDIDAKGGGDLVRRLRRERARRGDVPAARRHGRRRPGAVPRLVRRPGRSGAPRVHRGDDAPRRRRGHRLQRVLPRADRRGRRRAATTSWARLITARDDGTLDEDEFLANATTLVGAAYHNTRNHIATGIFTLLQHPDQLAKLRADPSLARAANEEVLRYEPPVQVTLPRVALVDTKIGEVELAAGEQVSGFLSGAARDPRATSGPTSSTSRGSTAARSRSCSACTRASARRWRASKARSRSGRSSVASPR